MFFRKLFIVTDLVSLRFEKFEDMFIYSLAKVVFVIMNVY